jgi:phosphoglycerate-specific signal transduction histidine kinase
MEDNKDLLIRLALLGLVTETISHEFNVLRRNVRESISSLKKSENLPQQEKELVERLNNLYMTMESKLNFYSPLYKQIGSPNISIIGGEIASFISQEYALDTDKRSIQFSKTFCNSYLGKAQHDVIFSSVISVLENAIYWSTIEGNKGEIRFIKTPNGFAISDNGKGVNNPNLFQAYSTTRPRGKGLGLFLSKKSLEKIGWDLTLATESIQNCLPGATFIFTDLNTYDKS